MIQFIIRDFQSIEEAKITVDGFTLLLGESSAGKSSILKAINCAFNNRFRNGQVRYGADQAVIKAKFSDSDQIFTAIRPWTGSIRMQLGQVPYSKIGRALPLDISNLLNTSNIDVSGDVYSLNFHEQFQKPLLLEFSQKKVMDLLSASQGLDDLQETKGYLAQKKAENKGAFQTVDAILSSTKEELSKVNNILTSAEPYEDELDNSITAYESFQKTLNVYSEVQQNYDTLCKLNEQVEITSNLVNLLSPESAYIKNEHSLSTIGSLQDNVNLVETYNKYLSILNDGCVALDKGIEIESKIQDYIALLDFILDFQSLSDSFNQFPDLQEFESALTSYTSTSVKLADLVNLTNFVNLSEEQNEKIEQSSQKVSALQTIVANADSIKEYQRINTDVDSLNSLHLVYQSQQGRISQLNNIIENHICPVCGSKVQ